MHSEAVWDPGHVVLPRMWRKVRVSAVFALALLGIPILSAGIATAQEAAGQQVSRPAPGVPFTAEKLSSLLPQAVYFQGRTASLQLRNAAGTTFANGAIVWAALVDTSGYASDVQDRYQFYLVTEGPLRVGASRIAAGAYGAGFVGDHFIVMDLGGHTVAEGPVQTDAALARPRPLQMMSQSATAVKLLLGRRWVTLQEEAPGAGR